MAEILKKSIDRFICTFLYILKELFQFYTYHWRLYLTLTNIGPRVIEVLSHYHLISIYLVPFVSFLFVYLKKTWYHFIHFFLITYTSTKYHLCHCQLLKYIHMKRIPTQGFYWASIFLTFINQEWYKKVFTMAFK